MGFPSEPSEHPNKRFLDIAQAVASSAIIYTKFTVRGNRDNSGLDRRVDLLHQLVSYDKA
jgi:hypothetical protein